MHLSVHIHSGLAGLSLILPGKDNGRLLGFGAEHLPDPRDNLTAASLMKREKWRDWKSTSKETEQRCQKSCKWDSWSGD